MILIIFSFLNTTGQGRKYNFLKLNTSNGLSHNQVNAIMKDSDGFLWFGTMYGLNRYDGYSFKTFKNKISDKSSIIDNSILAINELPGKKLWINTRIGICIYNSETEKFDADYGKFLISLGLPSNPIS
ncbi:MAG: two-component regulator propeller domain-containing protein, partial [Chitinophagaceae bacterium]